MFAASLHLAPCDFFLLFFFTEKKFRKKRLQNSTKTEFSDGNTEPLVSFSCRFPQLFPPLKPEVVAQRTVDAVRADKAFLYLPWMMHVLVFLKR